MSGPHQGRVRTSFLDDVVDSLTRHEIRYLQARIRKIDLSCDILSKLPLELSQHIAQYLEIFQVFRAQRVSKEWCRILSSPYFIDNMCLQPWFSEKSDSRESYEHLSPRLARSLKAEQIDAFCCGRPQKMAQGQSLPSFCMPLGLWDDRSRVRIGNSIDYAGGIFAHTLGKRQSVHLRCLRTGVAIDFTVPNEESVGLFAMSTSLLTVITTVGNGYAWDLSSGLTMSRCLNPQSPQALGFLPTSTTLLTVSNLTVAKVSRAADRYDFTSWDMVLRKVHHFSIKCQNSVPTPQSFKLIITNQGNSLVFFERVLDDQSYVHFTRFTLNGQIKSQGSIVHPNLDNFIRHSDFTTPSNTSGCITIWSYARTHPSKPDTLYVLCTCFYANKDRLELKEHLVNGISGESIISADWFWWHDVAFPGWRTGVCKQAERGWNMRNQTAILLGDETFLVIVRHGYYVVWCFDKTVALAGELNQET